MATFDFFRNVRSTGVICTRTLFEGAVQAPALRKLLAQIAAETDDERRGELKKRLPIVTWQAHFPGGRRKNADAQPSGLFMVDIDHVDNPKGLYEERIKPLIKRPTPAPSREGGEALPLTGERGEGLLLPILAVHLTPSTKGLRIVAVCDPALDIAGNQQRVADVLGVEIDSVCKDLARSSFLVSKEYFYYLDEAIWKPTPKTSRPTPCPSREGGEEDPSKSPREGRLVSAESPRSPLPSITGGVGGGSSLPLTGEQGGGLLSYLGIPYSVIIKKWWDIHYGGQEPVHSNRNTLTFELACALRHITGFSRELLDRIIPCYDGFPEQEKLACIDSALKERITRMPPRLHQVLLSIKAENADNLRLVRAIDEAEEQDEQHYINRIPSAALPMGVRDSLEGLPRTMALPALIGIGPMIGALATGVRLDVHGDLRHLNLTAYIVGEAASNKSKLDALYLLWMGKLIREDDEALKQEQEFIRLREQRKNAKEQPKDPQVLVRCQSLRTSIAQLLTRLQQSQGKHLYSYTSEADQLSQNSSAAWANTSVLQRDAYDNSAYTTDFANGKSTGVVIHKVLWNMTLCCTPDALYRAHRNYTNGAITRLALARTPDNTYAPLADAVQRSPQAERNIARVAEVLELMQGDVCLPLLEERCRAWLERIRLETLKNDDRVKARLRMRAPVTAMRYTVCFMLCAHAEALLRQLDDCEGERPAWADGCQTAKEYLEAHTDTLNDALQAYQTPDMLTLFDTLADYTLDMLLHYFRTRIEAAYEAADYPSGERERTGKNDSYFSRLPTDFTLADAIAVRGANGSYNATYMMLRNWMKQGLVVRTDRGKYRKIEKTVITGSAA
jgi:hypothetical protein